MYYYGEALGVDYDLLGGGGGIDFWGLVLAF